MKTKDFSSWVTAVLIVLLALPVVWMYEGWVLSILWGWFIVPMGITQISIWHAVGIALFVSLFRTRSYIKEEFEIGFWKRTCMNLATPILTLICGYFIKGWM